MRDLIGRLAADERDRAALKRISRHIAFQASTSLATALLCLTQAAVPATAQSSGANEVSLSLTALTHPADVELVYSLASDPGGAATRVMVTTKSGRGSETFRVSHQGTLHITQTEAPNLRLESIRCSGAIANVDLASRKVVLAIASDGAISCTFTNSASDQTADLTRQTLQRTATTIAGLPSSSDRVTERLSASMGVRKIAVPEPADKSEEDGERRTSALIPLTGDGTNKAGNAKFAANLSDIAEAKAREQAEKIRGSGLQVPGITVTRSRFDGWAEGSLGYAHNSKDNTSDAFSNLAVGADYRLNERWLIGLMGNYSTIDSATFEKAPDITGKGWMAGPYAGYKINRQMFLSLKALHGVGETHYLATAETPLMADGLETTRWLFDATLTGNWKSGNWTLSPSAQFIHFAERGSLINGEAGGAAVRASADSGRFLFGPQISYEFTTDKETKVTPRAAVKGLWELEEIEIDGATVGDLKDESLSTRVEAGIAVTSSKAKLDFSASLEGLGSETEKAASGKATLSVPLN